MTYLNDPVRMQAYLRRIREFRPIDDAFLSFMLQGSNETAEYILRVILEKEDLQVLEVRSQSFVQNVFGRSARFDILACDKDGVQFNVEIQRADSGAISKRARFNSAMMDYVGINAGEDWQELKETYTIFITEHDVLKSGLPIYHVERKILETGEFFNDGEHIIYVNSSHQDLNSELGRLMHDFYCNDPEEMLCKPMKERVKILKETKEGNTYMCESMEELLEEGIEIGIEKGRLKAQKEAIANVAASLRKESPSITDDEITTLIMKYLNLSENEVKEALQLTI